MCARDAQILSLRRIFTKIQQWIVAIGISSNVITDINTNITIDVDETVEQIGITYLREIIREKDTIICNQAMLIESLQAQISLLNRDLENNTQANTRWNTRNLLIRNAKTVRENSHFKSAKYIHMKHLHVTNCDPDTTQEALSSYLQEIVCSVQVEALISRNFSQHSSFKLLPPTLNAPEVLNQNCGQVVKSLISFFYRKDNLTLVKEKGCVCFYRIIVLTSCFWEHWFDSASLSMVKLEGLNLTSYFCNTKR